MQSFIDLKDFNVEIKRETRRKFDNHFFTSTNNIHHCKLCQYKVSVNISKSGHSKLANHVIEDHEFEMREFFERLEKPKKKQVQLKIVSSGKQEAYDKRIVNYFVKAFNLSLRHVESEAFLELMKFSYPGIHVMGKDKLSSAISKHAYDFRSEMINRKVNYFSISVDGYSKGQKKVFGVSINLPDTASNGVKSYLLTLVDITNVQGSGTAEFMRKLIWDIVDKFKLKRDKLTGVFADGTSANILLFQKLHKDLLTNEITSELSLTEELIDILEKDVVLQCGLQSRFRFIPAIDNLHVISLIAKKILEEETLKKVKELSEKLSTKQGYQLRMLSYVTNIIEALKKHKQKFLNDLDLSEEEVGTIEELLTWLLQLKEMSDGTNNQARLAMFLPKFMGLYRAAQRSLDDIKVTEKIKNILRALISAFEFRDRYKRIIYNPVFIHYCSDYSLFDENQRELLQGFRKSFQTTIVETKKRRFLTVNQVNIQVKLKPEEERDMNEFLLSLSNTGTSFLEIHFSYLSYMSQNKRSSNKVKTILDRVQARQMLSIIEEHKAEKDKKTITTIK